MSEATEAILRISQEDRNIQLNQIKLDKFPAQRQELRKSLSLVETRLNQLKAKENKLLERIQLRERLIQVEKDKLTHSNEKMANVSNQKEYSAIQKEIDGIERTIRRTEDQILELEEKQEPLKVEIAEEQKAFDEENEKFQVKLKVSESEENEILKETENSRKNKADLATKISPELKKQYEDLTSRKVIPAAIEISTSSCQGCAMSIRPQIFNEIIREGMGTCPTCRRILFYKAPEPPPDQGKKKK